MHSSSSIQPNSSNTTLIPEPNPLKTDALSPSRIAQKSSKNPPRSLASRLNVLQETRTDASLAFEPNVQTTIRVGTAIGFNHGANVYDEIHNMIISCPSNSQVHFLDANSLAPHSSTQKRKIDSSVVQMSYDSDTGTYLLGCAAGEIYAYNPSLNTLTRVLKQGNGFVLAISHINSDTFAFSSSANKQLYFRSTSRSEIVSRYCKDSVAWYLLHVKEQGVLLAGLANGQIAIYNTRKCGKYQMISSIQAHVFDKHVVSVISVSIKGQEYVVSASNDKTIKMWGLVKGKMRMLKVIQTNEEVSTVLYIEKYQMIATTHHSDYVNFYKVPTMELKSTLRLKEAKKARNMFLMKDKNAIGVADLRKNIIEIVQLHPSEKEVETSSQISMA